MKDIKSYSYGTKEHHFSYTKDKIYHCIIDNKSIFVYSDLKSLFNLPPWGISKDSDHIFLVYEGESPPYTENT